MRSFNNLGRGRLVYVLHGINNPFDEGRSTDWLASRLRVAGFNVVELRYDWVDMSSQFAVANQIRKIKPGNTLIAHSWGGILADLVGNHLNHIDVATVHSDIKGTKDWLFEIGDPTWVEGRGHTLNNETIFDAIMREYESRFS